MNEKQLKHISKLIKREVSYFNGWSVTERSVDKACNQAAANIDKYLKRVQRREEKK